MSTAAESTGLLDGLGRLGHVAFEPVQDALAPVLVEAIRPDLDAGGLQLALEHVDG
jgi:hypothetical protein